MMKKLTQSQLIVKFLESRYPDYVYGYELVKVNTPKGWIGSSGDRRARELAEKGIIKAMHEGKYVKYQFAQEWMIKTMDAPWEPKELSDVPSELKQLSLI